jgi:carbonic anhydrase
MTKAAKLSPNEGVGMGSMDAQILSDGQTYTFELLQFHFHTGSEHTINGVRYDLCMHMVHATTASIDRPYAVLGLLFEEGAENPFL